MNYLKRLLHDCHGFSILALKSKNDHVPFTEKLELKFHVAICKCCKNFIKQSDQIDQSLKAYFSENEITSSAKVSDDFKIRMKEKFSKLR